MIYNMDLVRKILKEIGMIETGGYSWFYIPLLFSSAIELSRILKIDLEVAERLHEAIKQNVKEPFTIITESDLKVNFDEKSILSISSGSRELDKIMGGGFKRGRLYQITGPAGSGKSQILYQIIVNFIKLHEKDGGIVGFIDTDLSFRPSRILEMGLQYFQLKNVLISKCYSAIHAAALLKNFKLILESHDSQQPSLLAVDSLTPSNARFYDKDLIEKQFTILGLLKALKKVALKNKTCIIFTNNSPAGQFLFSGGGYIQSYSDYIISVNKIDEKRNIFKGILLKSPCFPESQAYFQVTSDGIKDV
ncbi:MAG: ATPase domain-containing protein [Promethearchaeota archaeon]